MPQYIDKTALVAEIERRIKYDEMVMNHNTQITELLSRELNTLYELLSFIKSLEVKEVDINKEISQFINANFEKATIGHKLSLRRTAKHFFELGLKAQKGE